VPQTARGGQTVVNVVWIPGFHRVSPSGDYLWQIIWVDGIAGAATLQLFESFAEVLQGLVVDERDLTFRSHGGYEAENAINDLKKTLFTVLYVVGGIHFVEPPSDYFKRPKAKFGPRR
jgi:hypothetical protein